MAPNDLPLLAEEPPCITNVHGSSWLDDNDSICLEYPEDKDEGHDLYLQRDGLEFMIPIVFEDGMDFEESQLYYVSIESQLTGGALPCLQKKQQTRSSTRDITCPVNSISLPSCLRKPRTAKSKPREPTPQRRCSFGGLPKCGHVQQTLVRFHSMRGLGGIRTSQRHRLS
jgi:hypothetical protein